MSKIKKVGVILIIIGICLPIIFLAFASPYYPNVGLIYNIQTMKIVLREERFTKTEYLGTLEDLKEQKQRPEQPPQEIKVRIPEKTIPYKYIFAFGVILIFTGIGIIVLSGNKQSGAEQ